MQDAMVVVITNLKPRNLGGWRSAGMVLCAETHDKSKVEFLAPPPGSQIGDHVFFDGYPRKPLEQLPNSKKEKPNAWDLVAPRLVIDGGRLGCYKDASDKCIPFKTDKGVCMSATITNGIIK